MARFLIFLLFFIAAHSSEIEMFWDCAWDAKGNTQFPLMEETPSKDLPLPSLLRRKLRERGEELRSWELDVYQPLLMSGQNDPISAKTKCWMFWNLGPKLSECDFSKVPKEKMVLVMWEPPTVQPELYDPQIQAHFGTIFTWDDDLVDNQKFFKFHYPALNPRIKDTPPFEKKKFCVMISRRLTSKHPKELYSKRKATIKFFEKKPAGEFDLYGFKWKEGKYKNYKGPIHGNKLEKLKEYKFSICYENMGDVRGYITEKIFDCFTAGVVPVYWGASNITDYIPESCFIDRRRFASDEEMYQFLKKVTKEKYQQYLDSTAEFLVSDKAKLFTNEYCVENFISKLYFTEQEKSPKY
jgi:hypothetical protein